MTGVQTCALPIYQKPQLQKEENIITIAFLYKMKSFQKDTAENNYLIFQNEIQNVMKILKKRKKDKEEIQNQQENKV